MYGFSSQIVVIRNQIKIASFFFDAVNTFVTQIVIAANGDNVSDKRDVVITFGVLYFIFSVFQYIYHVYQHHKEHEEEIQSNRNKALYKFRAMYF